MLRIVVTPEREMIAAHERARARVPAKQEQQSQVMGTLEAARLLDRREFVYRGRPYHIPPVPWPLAAELLDVQQGLERIRALGKEAPLEETLSVFGRAARLSKRACRPVGFIRRLLWPLTPNPFAKATPWQVGRTLGFFSMSLMLDGDLLPPGSRAPGTSSPTSPRSSPAFQPGRARTATRYRGGTS